MKSIELLATGIRLLGIYVFINAAQMGITQYSMNYQLNNNFYEGAEIYLYAGIILTGVLVFISLIMLKFPVTIANWLLPKTKGDEVVFDGSARDIEVSAFVIIGVYILSWTIPDLLDNGLQLWRIAERESLGHSWGSQYKHEYVFNEMVTVLEIAIGIFLCLRARGLSYLLYKIREAGAR